jgi:cellulose synthase/poly-beta-1,6-N-acetylglucosamine synthase-like glycosyltransferase
MRKTNKRIHHLWETYDKTRKHILTVDPDAHRHTKVHISSSGYPKATVLYALLACVAGVIISLLLVNSRILTQDFQSERAFSRDQRLSFLLVFNSLYLAAAVIALAVKNLLLRRLKPYLDLLILLAVNTAFVTLSLFYSFQPVLLGLVICINTIFLIIGRLLFRHYSYAGLNFYLASCVGMVIGIIWGVNFFIHMPASFVTKLLLLCASPLLLVSLPSAFLRMLELYDIVCRERWRKIRHPYPHQLASDKPFVSIHVPTYSEPPDMVIETLNKLATIDYEHYEVIVIDNNTKDPALWRPVEAHCAVLGHRFRFIHAEGITGAKGGALNYIFKEIDPRATIIGVIDADYQVDPNFLQALVGHFGDPKIGFVQTPHDYREWKNNLFLSMCYWEYKLFFHSAMVSLNERDAGITVGTMCLVRKDVLEKAGGWSEWCVTEDSELAIRIHDIGYSSIYIDKTYGRGLIPDSFEGYKKQRYRWTAGPVQEFLHYTKHFIGLSKRDSKFTLIQRIFHLNHGLGNFLLSFQIPLLLIGVASIASMISHNEIIHVPFELWLTATITLLATPVLTMVMYRVTVKAKLSDIIGQALAAQALGHVIIHAALRTAITGNAAWNRTNKFKSAQSYFVALWQTKEEIIIGLSLVAFVVTSYIIFPYQGLSLMLLIGVAYVSLSYLAAPLMAVIGVWSFKHESRQALEGAAVEVS